MSAKLAVETWHALVEAGQVADLQALLAEDVTFHSPVVHTPQRGKQITTLYLAAALSVFGSAGFHYVRELIDGDHAALEFIAEIDGISINGVDFITANESGQITDFKVMIRPLKAVNLLHQKMGEVLAQKQRT